MKTKTDERIQKLPKDTKAANGNPRKQTGPRSMVSLENGS